MKFLRHILLFSLALVLNCSALADKKPVKVFILAGQSNMEGKGRVDPLLNHQITAPETKDFFAHLHKDGKWQALPLPPDIAAGVPDVGGETEQCGHPPARLFVRDIQGGQVEPYPTFREGSQYQRIIDLIREHDGWTDVTLTAGEGAA